MDYIELIVLYSDGWRHHSALSQDIGFLEADRCGVISKQHISNEHFVNLGLGSEAGKIEKPAI